MTRVLAQGTFDILHPGHVHYLEAARSFGDELHVIVARGENVDHKEPPILPDGQRRTMVAALDPVDEARVGHESDIFAPVADIDPDVLVLGHDQYHDEDGLTTALAQAGIDCRVERASPYEGEADWLLSTGTIIEQIITERGTTDPAQRE